MTTPQNNQNPQAAGLTPDGLANQLFDAAISQLFTQKVNDPREAARRVVQFLTESLFYAITNSKNDVIVFLTETLIYVATSSASGDEAARKELLKHIGDTIANAPPIPVTPPAVAGTPGAPGAPGGAPGFPGAPGAPVPAKKP